VKQREESKVSGYIIEMGEIVYEVRLLRLKTERSVFVFENKITSFSTSWHTAYHFINKQIKRLRKGTLLNMCHLYEVHRMKAQ
jgi:hypothetical protein